MSFQKKRIAVLGSTGSIGERALSIISDYSEKFDLVLISCNSNEKKFIEQINKFNPEQAIINSKEGYNNLSNLGNKKTKINCGEEALCNIISEINVDVVLIAIVGFAALRPTVAAINSKKNIALASKETLVVAGNYITSLVKKMGVKIIPVDSEHSAIFQCLQGEKKNDVSQLLITASGGPFRGRDKSYLKNITVSDALNHPNWKMGNKITIDSATLMNKGFEVIEAKWLFGLEKEKIKVLVHPESIIHSLVEFCDSSVIAQLGLPNMNVPILYALSFPNRLVSNFKKLDLTAIKQLNFEDPDLNTFKHLNYAYEAMDRGGSLGCVLNAANEIAVEAFLSKKIPFLDMQKIIEKSMESVTFVAKPTIEDLFEIDIETRRFSSTLI